MADRMRVTSLIGGTLARDASQFLAVYPPALPSARLSAGEMDVTTGRRSVIGNLPRRRSVRLAGRDTERPTRLDGDQEAHLSAWACSQPPPERRRWAVRLLAQKFVELGYREPLSPETMRQTLKASCAFRSSAAA